MRRKNVESSFAECLVRHETCKGRELWLCQSKYESLTGISEVIYRYEHFWSNCVDMNRNRVVAYYQRVVSKLIV
jgi:N-glycosylase/DNA lyase